MNPFQVFYRKEAAWTFVGLTSSFPNLGGEDDNLSRLSQHRLCNAKSTPGCKAFHIPQDDSSKSTEMPVGEDALVGDLKDQVLVYQYKGKFHAVDHSCPHSSYPLSESTPFDIEDFGVVLSAGLSCPKHDWSFDMFTGMSDRASYLLKVWEVQLRETKGTESPIAKEGEDSSPAVDKEVWVRRKQRIG